LSPRPHPKWNKNYGKETFEEGKEAGTNEAPHQGHMGE
jgi:hypothetical protein